MSRILRLTVCFLLMAEGVRTRAAEQLATKSAPEPPSVQQNSLENAWSDPENYLRPHKGVRFEHGQSASPTLLWVLCSPTGQPLAVCSTSDTKVDNYFRSRLAAELAKVTNTQRLRAAQIDKLMLAANVDLARLKRLAHRTEQELAKSEAENERRVNNMLHALAMACDQELFEEKSLFSRVLATQLGIEKSADQ